MLYIWTNWIGVGTSKRSIYVPVDAYQYRVHVLLSNVVRVQNTHSIARLHVPLELNRIFFYTTTLIFVRRFVFHCLMHRHLSIHWTQSVWKRMQTNVVDTRECTVCTRVILFTLFGVCNLRCVLCSNKTLIMTSKSYHDELCRAQWKNKKKKRDQSFERTLSFIEFRVVVVCWLLNVDCVVCVHCRLYLHTYISKFHV